MAVKTLKIPDSCCISTVWILYSYSMDTVQIMYQIVSIAISMTACLSSGKISAVWEYKIATGRKCLPNKNALLAGIKVSENEKCL